jgi:hypothetical protein
MPNPIPKRKRLEEASRIELFFKALMQNKERTEASTRGLARRDISRFRDI